MTSVKKASRTKSLSLSEDFSSRLSKPIKNPPLTSISSSNCNSNSSISNSSINSNVSCNTNPSSSSSSSTTSSSSSSSSSSTSSQSHQQIATITTNKKAEDAAKILKYIDENIIGKGVAFLGPFGRRKVVYADYDSSGRSLQFLEDYINREVLPAFGDSTCTSAVTGLQSKLYCNEAKDIIRIAVNASEDDSLFFTQGSCANLSEKICTILCNTNCNDSTINCSPVLFVSSSEIIGNIMPWINAGVEVIRITKTREGFLDLVCLEKKLAEYSNLRRLLIGYFSGASRLTGILSDDVATTILLHQYGAISVWDFSSAGSYAPLDMNPHLPGAAKDVMCFNTNKFIGGVQGPGVVVIKKSVFSSSSPNNSLDLFDNVGTVEYVRAGLVMQLKESLGVHNIAVRQEKLCRTILSHIRTIPEILLLGSLQTTAKRIPTICFLVKHPRGSFLHHKFVVAVLNDVFGVQATAGVHIGDALGISDKLCVDYERILLDETLTSELIRPGYTKLLFPYFMPESEVAYILEALKMVATEAWKLLPQYEVDDTTGEWRHHSNSLAKERKWLGTIRYNDGRMQFSDRRISGPGTFPQNYSDSLQTARNLFNRSRKMAQKSMTPFLELKLKRDLAEKLRWFMLPGEAHELLLGHSQNVKNSVPFNPNRSHISELPSLLTMFRHNSLSALDVKRFKSRSLPTSPIQIPVRREQSPPIRYSESNCNTSPPVVRFSLGGEVTTLATYNSPSARSMTNNNDVYNAGRIRCHSWSESNKNSSKSSTSASTSSSSSSSCSTSQESRKRIRFKSISSDKDVNHCNNNDSNYSNFNSILNQRSKKLIKAASVPCQSSTIATSLTVQNYSNFQKPLLCSCSSQTDLYSPENLQLDLRKSNKSASSICSEAEDIQAYVAGVTKKLATDIKSEIREVITKVEDVLESTDGSINLSSITVLNSTTNDDFRSDSVSASDVAEYLEECSRKMANDVKTEIREAVSDLMLSDSFYLSHQKKSYSESDNDDAQGKYRLAKQRFSDSVARTKQQIIQPENDTEKLRSESFPRPQSTPGWHHPSTAQSLESSTPNCPYTGAISKLQDPVNTSSQDSGINMCFHDHEDSRIRTASDSLNDSRKKILSRLSQTNGTQTSINESTSNEDLLNNSSSSSIQQVQQQVQQQLQQQQQQLQQQQQQLQQNLNKCEYSNSTAENLNNCNSSVSVKSIVSQLASQVLKSPSSDNNGELREPHLWQHVPREVWKQTAEAIDEFTMIKEGDKILVCLSGSSASLSLLHAIRQFSRARGIHIEMSAITIGKCGVDPRALMLYLRDINIELFIENLAPSENYLTKICSIARRKHFNVIAMGNSLDKCADDFLMSVLYKGKLFAPQAHYTNRDGDIRIIRPFIYVREKYLEDFTVHNNLPTRPSQKFCKPLDASNSILRVQEIVYPGVYDNIKSAIRPLLSARLENHNHKSSYEFLKLSLNSRD